LGGGPAHNLDEEAQRRCVEIADLRVPTGIGRTAKKGKKVCRAAAMRL